METVAQIWLRIRACADADTPHRLTVLDRSDCRLLLASTRQLRDTLTELSKDVEAVADRLIL